jgi:hypothetical protein
MWGYDESREDLTYEHWYAVFCQKMKWLYESREAKVFLAFMRLITALVVQMMELLFDKINRAISL